MKKTALVLTVAILSAGIACAFPETSSFNNAEMQQLQNLQYNTRNDYDNVSNFKERKQQREERAKQMEERQKRIEQRAKQQPTQNVQFINENGTIKIQNQ